MRPTQDEEDLFEAVDTNNVEEVRRFLDNGTDVDTRSVFGDTLLMNAAVQGGTETVKLLLERGADVHLRNEHEATALMLAENYWHPEVIKLLQDHINMEEQK
jgi:ankyrin repeat protein